ncbi:MAG: phosphohydrolase [Deltaproteobacteria bacterium]|nr:phosphohydrolase [Deltaproteobacteria bacterium]
MSWIQTYTGRQFFPLEPRPADVDVRDIAHSLAMQCRFNGHCRPFYSVAEHSVRVSRILEGRERLWGLLHDAAEAYISDLPRPLKATAPGFRAAEDRLLEVIVTRFGLPWPMPAAVAHADEVLLATEMRDLMAPAPAAWPLDAAALAETIVPVGHEEAERLFLARFAELGQT